MDYHNVTEFDTVNFVYRTRRYTILLPSSHVSLRLPTWKRQCAFIFDAWSGPPRDQYLAALTLISTAMTVVDSGETSFLVMSFW